MVMMKNCYLRYANGLKLTSRPYSYRSVAQGLENLTGMYAFDIIFVSVQIASFYDNFTGGGGGGRGG